MCVVLWSEGCLEGNGRGWGWWKGRLMVAEGWSGEENGGKWLWKVGVRLGLDVEDEGNVGTMGFVLRQM